jgi:hypothetical protein
MQLTIEFLNTSIRALKHNRRWKKSIAEFVQVVDFLSGVWYLIAGIKDRLSPDCHAATRDPILNLGFEFFQRVNVDLFVASSSNETDQSRYSGCTAISFPFFQRHSSNRFLHCVTEMV